MNIQLLKLTDIKPYPNNPRINDKAVDRVIASINEFGFNSPIVVDGNLMIINGHTRYKASQKMNLEKVPVVIVDNLTNEQVKAYRIADNKTAEYSEWDYDKLIKEIQELCHANYDLDMTGFDESECLKMIEDLSEFDEKVPEDDIDVESELEKLENETPTVKRGQIYKLGKHYLMCGDSTCESDVRKLMSASGEEVKASLVWTDPPYNVAYEDSKGRSIKNDDMDSKAFKEFLDLIFMNYDKFTEKNCPFYVCYASREHINFENSMKDNGINVRTQIIWVKNVATFGFAQYKWKHEPILYGAKEKGSIRFYGDRKNTTVWENLNHEAFEIEKNNDKKIIKIHAEGRDYHITVSEIENIEIDSHDNSTVWKVPRESNYVHPNQKPLQLIMKAINNSSQAGDIMLELFGGSGSTLIAAEQMGRVSYNMELDPVYAQVIINRFELVTGIKAELIN
ncbi:DNA modification methylase [Clostridium botulinum]|uniref:DNA modification methylase n=1 Tax=Clostridium botulinum TaxID=1491 RepID=UPI0006A6D038|nr:DNA methyltransferase [Clostridium botulinum]KAI3350133.1 ParB N-terminal domain-containing protein [Clostridium botulinum]KOM88949.1 hypothetical protein ACP51_04235 [Clostridium botulinum]KOR63515.1 hypothetical protein ADT22_03020 [Clostridium botulinum]MCS6111529.1 DNA modification methylase [Clostridium botulinum]NFE10949.1 DNA modification methylase [Clostridium botulinum]